MISTLISFDRGQYQYHVIKKKEKWSSIGGYELAFFANLVVSYLFEKANNLLNRTTYHGIYSDYGLVVFKENNNLQDIRD